MADLFDKHLQQVDAWLSQQENFHVLSVDYNAMLIDPTPDVARIVDFLPQPLDSDAMAAVVDPTLYRNRG